MATETNLKPIEMNKATWTARLEAELSRVVAYIIEHSSPQKIILFGSFAQGDAQVWSDIDLVVVKESNERFLDRSKDLLAGIMPQVGLDILVYTPEEFQRLCQERIFFQEEIMKKGKVLYEQSR